MLVLSRLTGETIVIGKDIKVRVLSVRGDRVSLGIEAPRAVPVHRQEVFEAIQRGEATTGVSRVDDSADDEHKAARERTLRVLPGIRRRELVGASPMSRGPR